VPASSVIEAKGSKSLHQNNRKWKTENNCNTFSFGLWEETDTICYLKKKKILKESEILVVMRKDG
jgi:hypothetical protein